MKTIKPFSLALLFTCLTSLPCVAIADTYYKWVDENGTTHYGNQPSKEYASTPVHTSGQHSGPTSSMAPTKKSEQSSSEETSNDGSEIYDAEELANYCKGIKERLDLMIAKNQIKQKNKDGSVVMLTEEQRQQQISDLKTKLADKCQ